MKPDNRASRPTPRRSRTAALIAVCVATGIAAGYAAVPKEIIQDDRRCLECHQETLYRPIDREAKMPPFVSVTTVAESVHGRNGVACAHCHTEATEVPHPPDMEVYTCSDCHEPSTMDYRKSIHGEGRAQDVAEAARCIDCHGTHDIYEQTNPRSRTHRTNMDKTCLKCHTSDEMAKRFDFTRFHIAEQYEQSVHARMIAAGHEEAATCNDCHGSHNILPSREPESWVNRSNIPETCGKCHWVVKDEYAKSIHGRNFAAGKAEAPVCNSCHRDHNVLPAQSNLFKLSVISECGHCHEDLLQSYRMSYHGKITELGATATARCSDCHGYHDVLKVNEPESRVSEANLVQTCGTCHPASNENFVQYMSHSDYTDREKNPIVFYAWVFMITLLVGTLSFFTVHTLLWFVRSIFGGEGIGHHEVKHGGRYVRRFSAYQRFTHILVIVSFLGLTLTGFPLKYSYMPWAHEIFDMLGGFRVAGLLHRFFAILSFGYVFLHLVFLAKVWKVRDRKKSFFQRVLGPNSMVLTWEDVKQFFAHIRWFLFLGPRPKFDRWTYWEKFDYWGEVWGMTVIGTTGLMLWFPLFVSKFLPGWVFNVATVVHSVEALLAAGVIFTVHFFNAHFRPDKFPMDDVIFTGSMPEAEFKEERTLEYERLQAENRLEEILVDPPSRRRLLFNRIVGFAALTVGLFLIVCVILAEIQQHFGG